MGPSPITLGVGNGTLRCSILLTPAQRIPPPARDQPPRARQAELVICDQAIERLAGRLKEYRRIATRYDKLAASYLAFVQLATIRMWL
jgi:transposase